MCQLLCLPVPPLANSLSSRHLTKALKVMAPLETRDDPSKRVDKGPALTTVSVLFTILASITTVLRLWVRRGRNALGKYWRTTLAFDEN